MTAREYPEPRIVPRAEHQLSRSRVHGNAIKVLNRLNRAGFRGYLVGGSVRDHLLGRTPKDYDIATDARPNQIRKLFRNSRIIGRRFRLAHIYFHNEIIELATFRRDPDPDDQRGAPGELLITDDNVFGTPAEDAFRRDFTVNALFYNIADFSVVDYVGGIDDLEAGVMRIIGDPDLRFREDPVRMTRACEMAARLGFTIEDATQEGIIRHAEEIHKAAPARLAEEIGQIFRCGAASSAVQWMHELGLAEELFPEFRGIFEAKKSGLGDFTEMIRLLDKKAANKNAVSEIGLYSSLLLPAVLVSHPKAIAADGNTRALREVVAGITEPLFRRLSIAKHKVEHVAHTIAALQKLDRREWTTRERIRFANRPYFADALLVYEAWIVSTDGNPSELREWKRVARAASQAVSASEGRGGKGRAGRSRPRRRRSRKGRRKTN